MLPRYAELDLAGGHVPRGQRPASRLVPELAARGAGDARPAAVPRGADPRLPDRPRRPQDVEVARQRHRAAGRHQGERRRDPPAVGGDERLHRGAARQQGDPDARRRRLPQAAQHLPHPGRNLYDFDPATDLVPVDAARRGRPLRAGALRRGGAADPARVRRLRLLHGRPDAEHAGDRRPERVLRGRHEGPDVHARRRVRTSGARRRRRCT